MVASLIFIRILEKKSVSNLKLSKRPKSQDFFWTWRKVSDNIMVLCVVSGRYYGIFTIKYCMMEPMVVVEEILLILKKYFIRFQIIFINTIHVTPYSLTCKLHFNKISIYDSNKHKLFFTSESVFHLTFVGTGKNLYTYCGYNLYTL